MANIIESAWLNRAHYEGAMDRFQVFKATGKTFQVRLSHVILVWLSQYQTRRLNRTRASPVTFKQTNCLINTQVFNQVTIHFRP